MKTQITCANSKCKEIPLIKLLCSNKKQKINIDCPFHHYKFELEQYLDLIEKTNKEYISSCSEHNKKYVGFFEDTKINICKNCILSDTEKGK